MCGSAGWPILVPSTIAFPRFEGIGRRGRTLRCTPFSLFLHSHDGSLLGAFCGNLIWLDFCCTKEYVRYILSTERDFIKPFTENFFFYFDHYPSRTTHVFALRRFSTIP